MIRRRFFPLACAALLLLAQHAAITHSLWHLVRHDPFRSGIAETATGQPEKHSPQSRLCDLHFALESLLSGDCGWSVLTPALALSDTPASPSFVRRVARLLPTPPSRAPPVVL